MASLQIRLKFRPLLVGNPFARHPTIAANLSVLNKYQRALVIWRLLSAFVASVVDYAYKLIDVERLAGGYQIV